MDPNLGAALDQLTAALDAVQAAGMEPLDAADARVVITEVEVQARRLRAAQVELVAAIERRGLHRCDGHASAKVLVRHVANLSNAEASRRARAAHALRDLPAVRDAFAAGRVGGCQVDLIARALSNTRVRHRLCRQDDALAQLAASLDHRRFEAVLSDWVRRADEDGTADRGQRSHENRDAKIVQDFDGSWTLSGGFGSLQGAELHEILRRFVDAEFATDWAKARIDHGDDATIEDLARSDGQRRADALFEIFQRAASAHASSEGGSQIVTNVVIDHATFERLLCRFAGGRPDLIRNDFDLETATADRYRCSTLDGNPIDPTEAVANALVGHVRRVVVGADSVVIDLGRRRRLFTGAAQLAAKLASTHCYWPGCLVPVTDCQIDHLLPWADHGGSTGPRNGGPACGRHNRHKEQGFRVTRDEAGGWHTYRPDGTEIT